ncbi:MAG: cellulase family glycosylhydrolase [Caulobacterales bacterium]|nr:cellulase family glycosylhydrolase [Caulobacterales bacterium]
MDALRALALGALVALAAVSGCATLSDPPAPASGFVQVSDGALTLDGAPYRFVGANLWYGAYLGAGGDIGDVERLRAELDLLKSLGVTNLRVLGASEDSPLRDAVTPAFRGPGEEYNETLLRGLDVLLAEMAERDMKAVIYLNNFWEWSGGMATYLSWTREGEIVDPADPEARWPAFALFTMQFYADEEANALFRDYIAAVIGRANTVTGRPYAEDPTIMAWQLANEPRPGYKAEPRLADLDGFYAWIDETAAFIKSLAPNHLVSSGNEGLIGCADHDPCFAQAHDTPHIDYLTFHLWPLNWGWIDPGDMDATIDRTLTNAGAYIDRHLAEARTLNKPIIIEEFGLPRDEGANAPGSPATHRDRFLAYVFGRIEQDAAEDGPFAGSNIWSWGGYGRAAHADAVWREGDTSYVGDPPQEPQGRNSVFDVDASTLAILKGHADALAAPAR